MLYELDTNIAFVNDLNQFLLHSDSVAAGLNNGIHGIFASFGRFFSQSRFCCGRGRLLLGFELGQGLLLPFDDFVKMRARFEMVIDSSCWGDLRLAQEAVQGRILQADRRL